MLPPRSNRCGKAGIVCLLVVGVWSPVPLIRPAWAQGVWAMNPYQVKVWLALEAVPELQSAWRDEIPKAILRRGETTFGAAWNLQVTYAPPAMSASLAADVSWPTLASLVAVDETLQAVDKLILVGVQSTGGGFQMQVREFDGRTRQWRAVDQRFVRQSSRLDDAVATAVMDSFTPIGLIGRSKDEKVTVTMKAGLLTGNAVAARIIPAVGSVLSGVSRRTDRLGKVVENGIQPIPWTLLRVESRDDRTGTIECRVVSGLRSPFRSRSSRQVERIAMSVAPILDSTTLQLHEQGDPQRRLAGYDIYFRLPDEKSTTLIGRTDWLGQIEVTRDHHPIKVMYVKNGGRILARLPIVPGFSPLVTAELVDDSRRLEAEGVLKGIQEQMVEITARRRVLSLRIRRAIADKKFDRAEALLDEMRSLQTRDDLNRKMRERQPSFSSNNRATQDRIDRMFRSTRDMLLKAEKQEKEINPPVDIDTLRQEITRAKS